MAALTELKRGKNFIVYTDGTQKLIKIENVRGSFLHFGAKKQDEGDDGNVRSSWNGVAMLPKKTHVEAKDALKEIISELLKTNDAKVPTDKWCLKNGDETEREEYQGHWIVSFSDSTRHPACRDKKGALLTDDAKIDDMFYGGCWYDVLLRPWYFNGKAKGSTKTYPKRISCGFVGVQFRKDDDPFGNGRVDDSAAWGSNENDDGDDGDEDDGDDGL